MIVLIWSPKGPVKLFEIDALAKVGQLADSAARRFGYAKNSYEYHELIDRLSNP